MSWIGPGLSAQAIYQYTIQLGKYPQASLAAFQKIAHLGFLYAHTADSSGTEVCLAGFETRERAEESLANLRRLGYTKAELTRKDLKTGKLRVYLQLGSVDRKMAVDWQKFHSVSSLFGLPTADALKILTGPFTSLAEAKTEGNVLAGKGLPGTFPREINELAIFPIGAFESNRLVRNPQKDTVLPARNQSEVPATKPAVSFWPPATLNPKMGAEPAISSSMKRNSVLSLQQVLKAEGFYSGAVTGYYQEATRAAFEAALKQSPEMRPFVHDDEPSAKSTSDPDRLADVLENLTAQGNPTVALEKFADPLAKGYLGYLTYLQKGPNQETDRLMNEALRGDFSGAPKSPPNMPFFDFKAVYAYPSLHQTILHLFYLHSAPDNSIPTPCWLHNAHPGETQAALRRYQEVKVLQAQVRGCDYLQDWRDVRLLKQVVSYLGGKQPEPVELMKAAEERALLLQNAQALDEKASAAALSRQMEVWNKMEAWGRKDPINVRMLNALKLAYYQSLVRVEDFFLKKDLPGADARTLAIATLDTFTAPYLDRFMK